MLSSSPVEWSIQSKHATFAAIHRKYRDGVCCYFFSGRLANLVCALVLIKRSIDHFECLEFNAMRLPCIMALEIQYPYTRTEHENNRWSDAISRVVDKKQSPMRARHTEGHSNSSATSISTALH